MDTEDNKQVIAITNINAYPRTSKCIPLKRHERDNINNKENPYFTKEINDIITQKLSNHVHLYLYHRLSNNSLQQNNRDGSKFDEENKKEIINNAEDVSGIYFSVCLVLILIMVLIHPLYIP